MEKKVFFKGSILFLLMAISFTLGGCASPSRSVQNIPAAATEAGKIPVAPLAQNLAPYRLQVGDVVEINLLLNPELNEEATVRPDGMISTAVAQDIRTYGKTAAELQQSLVEAYRKHLIDPQITVVVKKFTPSRVYVLGEVEAPGEMVSIGPNMTLLQALARSGGLRNSADESNVLIIRRGAGEKPEVYRADYASATRGDMPGQDVRLAPYDVVFVPRTGVADVYKAFQQNIQQFLPASLGFGYGMK
jgi:polysaccharide export outer membrane protein